jgi:asparagine N-glycosylation enzyme membrane subunit Stt3
MVCLTALEQKGKIFVMASEGARLPVPLWLGKTKSWWVALAVFCLAAFAVLLRCLRLFDSSTNYIYNPDSYFFHWLSQRVLAGEAALLGPNYTLHSGFSYPAAYIAKALAFVLHMSPTESLEFVWKFLPVAIALVSLIVMYFFVAKILGRRVAVFSVLTWALFGVAVFIGVAGNLDRDALSVLLLMVGAMLFYISRSWKLRIGNREVGWIVSCLLVLLVEILLYLEWSLMGAVALVIVISVYSVFKTLLEYSSLLEKERNVKKRIAIAIKRSDLRAFALIIALNLVAMGMYSYQPVQMFNLVVALIRGRFIWNLAGTTEEQGLTFRDLIGFQFFLIPMGMGIYLAWKKKNDAMVFFASWFASFLIVSFFIYRVFILAIPAACVVSGMGLASLWGIMGSRDAKNLWKQLGILVMALLLVLISFFSAYRLNQNSYVLTADKYWQQALTYLREDTPQNAVIMSQWSYGYWFLDVAQRQPFVDGGYYGYTIDKLRDVGLAYSTTDPSEASAIMESRGATYLVFGKQDVNFSGIILGWTGVKDPKASFSADSLVVRSINGDFVSGGGLQLVFRNNEVVILGLNQPA